MTVFMTSEGFEKTAGAVSSVIGGARTMFERGVDHLNAAKVPSFINPTGAGAAKASAKASAGVRNQYKKIMDPRDKELAGARQAADAAAGKHSAFRNSNKEVHAQHQAVQNDLSVRSQSYRASGNHTKADKLDSQIASNHENFVNKMRGTTKKSTALRGMKTRANTGLEDTQKSYDAATAPIHKSMNDAGSAAANQYSGAHRYDTAKRVGLIGGGVAATALVAPGVIRGASRGNQQQYSY
jgi:hypothetical protein